MNSEKDDRELELEMKKSSLEMYLNTLDEMTSRNSPQSSIESIQNEIKKLSEDGMLLFDEELMSYTMGNCITITDTNGNRARKKTRIIT